MTAFDSDDLLKRFLESTMGADTDLPAARLASAPVPAGVKAYLRAHLRERLSEELSRAPSFNRVRTLSPSAARLQHLFIEQAADSYVYPRGEFQADLENAVHFTENYVCRPRWTLSSFLFHTRDVIPTAELFAKLEYVTDYIYLPQLLRKTLAAKGQREIDRATCTELIRRIDAAVTREHAPRELAALAKPLFDFFSAGDQDGSQEIALRPVLLFFDDKEMIGVKEYITGIYHLRNRETITLVELAALCDDFLGVKDEAPPANETELVVSTPISDPAAVSEPASDPVHPDPTAVQSDNAPPASLAEPAYELPAKDPAGVTVPADVPDDGPAEDPAGIAAPADMPDEGPAEAQVAAPSALSDPDGARTGDPGDYQARATEGSTPPARTGGPGEAARELSIGDPGMDIEAPAARILPFPAPGFEPEPEEQLELPLAPPAPVSLPDLTLIITPEQRKRFINVLCDRDAQFYDLMIARLNQIGSWQEATGYVREIFEINAIDPFQDEAIAFIDIIQQRFATGTGPAA